MMADIIVAASGGFDPLHVGHIDYLEKAKKLGTKLVVILNTDEFLIRKKGYVFMSFEERMQIVAALRCVDEVVRCIDSDDTVCETLRVIRPHIFAKGGDRLLSRGNIPEVDVCKEIGCTIVDGLGKKIQSSRSLVDRARIVGARTTLLDKTLGCPQCGERRSSHIVVSYVHDFDTVLMCLTCGHEYTQRSVRNAVRV